MASYIQVLRIYRAGRTLGVLDCRANSSPKTLPCLCGQQIVFDLFESFCVYGYEAILPLAAQCQDIGTGAREIRYSRINPTARYVNQLVLGQLFAKFSKFPIRKKG